MKLKTQIAKPLNLLLLAIIGIHFSASPVALRGLADISLMAMIIFLIRYSVINWSFPFHRSGYEYAFSLLAFASLLSIGDAYLMAKAIPAFANIMISILFFYIITFFVQSKKDLNKVIILLFYGFVMFLLAGWYQHFNHFIGSFVISPINFIRSEARGLNRISSLFIMRSGTNVYSAYLAFFVPIYFGWLYSNYLKLSRGYKFVHILILILVFYNVIYTYSRGLYISLFFVALFLLRYIKYKKIVIPGFVIIALLVVLFVSPVNRTVTSLFDTKDMSNSDHLQSYHIAFEQIAEHPINGWGGGHINAKLRLVDGRWQNVYHSYFKKDGNVMKSVLLQKFPGIEKKIPLFFKNPSEKKLLPYKRVGTLAQMMPLIQREFPNLKQRNRFVALMKDVKIDRAYNQASLYTLYQEALADGVTPIGSPHNIYLNYFIEYGIFGFVAILFVFYTIFAKIIKVINKSSDENILILARASLYGMISFSVYCLFQDSLNSTIMALFFWLFAMVVSKMEEYYI